MNPPDPIRVLHFTHLRNLPGIIATGLRSDSTCRAEGLTQVEIGSSGIRDRRLRRPVGVGPRGFVGDYVPWYFAPRSPMMFTLGRNNYEYQQGFDDVVYLSTTLDRIRSAGLGWVASDRNAALAVAAFTDDVTTLRTHVRWDVMRLKYWTDVPEGGDLRAAELLVHRAVPWDVIDLVATKTDAAKDTVAAMTGGSAHQPENVVRGGWYFS